jgi:hypothetical protein
MPRIFLQLALFFSLTAGAVPAALADYYKYTDEGGAVSITNKLDSVPQKYRSRVKIISEGELAKKDQGGQKRQPAEPDASTPGEAAAPAATTAAAPAPASQGKFAELSARFIWFKPLLYLVGVIAAFIAVVKLSSLVPSPQLSKLIYLSFFLGVFVFLYKAYVTHVVEDSLAVKEKAVNMMKKSMVREVPLPGEAPPAQGK